MLELSRNYLGLSLAQALVLFLLSAAISVTGAISKCHSCFAGCRNVDECDCTSSDNDACQGQYCYVKLDRLSDDGLGSVQKGCANWAPRLYTDVCQYVNDNSTIECFCQGDSCNNITHLKNYQTEPLPLVSCCECSGYNYENETIDCLPDTCLRNCTGHYCYNDIVRQSQGCGWGHALAWQFLRSPNGADPPKPKPSKAILPWPWDKDGGNMTCTEAYSDSKTILRGCTCASDFCNMENVANNYVRNETEVRQSTEHYCYAVHAVSKEPITGDAYKQSTTCPGHYCFVSLDTTAVSYRSSPQNSSSQSKADSSVGPSAPLPTLGSRSELTAGCVLVDDESKVQTGCTVLWSETENRPTRKHCICAGHICNYFNLITGEDKGSLLAFNWKTSKDYKMVSSTERRKPAYLWFAVVIIGTLWCSIA